MIRTPDKYGSTPDVSTVSDKASSPTAVGNNSMRFKRKRPPELTDIQLEDIKKEIKKQIEESLKLFTDSQISQTNTVINSLKEVQQIINNVQCTISYLSEENSNLKKKIEQLEAQAKLDAEQRMVLENKMEEKQICDRKSNIEIKNLPLKGGETKKDLYNMMSKLSENIGVTIEK
ncbi:unnamed protein product [Chilo suppressalis]|uniref:Uncharacterized protein n=1 Tax=Chilo suppressalis TaxID=168631 RepID=A0ABN8B2B8_CHISP|nr:unnamed protein product [Chilo suppressalis]